MKGWKLYMKEVRCEKCGKLLFKIIKNVQMGEIEIKCYRCKEIKKVLIS